MEGPEDTYPVRRSPLSRLVAGIALSAAVALAGCGNDSTDDPGLTGATPTTTSPPLSPPSTESPATGPPAADPVCEDGELAERAYILCTSGNAPDQELVVALHGRGSSAGDMQAMTELDRYAAGETLAVVYPDAPDGWGDDTFTTPTRPSGDEDVVFLDALVDKLRSDPRIDAGPVGMVGFSNGASMALRYASERPDDVRAVVSVAGQLPRDTAVHPSRPVPLLQVYGAEDPVRSHEAGIPDSADRQPGDPTPTLSTAETVAAFVDPLAGAPEHSTEDPIVSDDDTSLLTERWIGDDGTVVVLHTLTGGGHRWPSEHVPHPRGDDFGVSSRALDASVEAVAFVVDPS